MIGAARILPDIDHPAADHFLAERANPAVIERGPFPLRISQLQSHQLFIERNVPVPRPRTHAKDNSYHRLALDGRRRNLARPPSLAGQMLFLKNDYGKEVSSSQRVCCVPHLTRVLQPRRAGR